MKKAGYIAIALAGITLVAFMVFRNSGREDALLALSRLEGYSVLVNQRVEPGPIHSIGAFVRWIHWRIGASPLPVYVSSRSGRFEPSHLDLLKMVDGVKIMKLEDTRIEFKDLCELMELRQIETFELRDIFVEKAAQGGQPLPNSAATSLAISGMRAETQEVRDNVVNHILAGSVKLSQLKLSSVNVDRLANHGVFERLSSLSLDSLDLSHDTPKFFSFFGRLKGLNLTNIEISVSVFGQIASMPDLRNLMLDSVELTGAHLEKLKKSPNLQILTLRNTNVEPSHLLGLTNIFYVVVDKKFPELSESHKKHPEMPAITVLDE